MQKIDFVDYRRQILYIFLKHVRRSLVEGPFDVEGCLRKTIQENVRCDLQEELWGGKFQQQLRSQLEVFGNSIVKGGEIWVQLIEKDEIEKEGKILYMNSGKTFKSVIDKFLSRMRQQFLFLSSQSRLQAIYLNEKNILMLLKILENMATIMKKIFDKLKKMVEKVVLQIQQSLKNCSIMNIYLLFTIFKQESQGIEHRIQKYLRRKLFKRSNNKIVKFISKYMIENYTMVSFYCIPHKIFEFHTKHSEEFFINQSSTEDSVSQHQSVSFDQNSPSQTILNIKNNHKKVKRLISHKDLKKKEKIQFQMIQLDKETQDFKKNIISHVSAQDPFVSLGTNIGKCLCNINQYNDVQSFIKDISKATVIGESLNHIVTAVPIMSVFFFTGGLFYSLYNCVNNQATNITHKCKEVGTGSLLFTHATLSAFFGVAIGQIMIPIPFLGGLTGGIIGGYWGSKGSQYIVNKLKSKKFRFIIHYLKNNIQNDSHWNFSVRTLDELGLDYEYFQRYNPRKKAKDYIWLSAICLCIVGVYEFGAQKQNFDREEDGKQNVVIDEKLSEVSFNISKITEFINGRGFKIMENLKIIEKMVIHIIDKSI